MERVIGFVMVLTRISAFFLVAPVFGSTGIPVTIRVAATVMLSMFFAAQVPVPAQMVSAPTVQLALTLVGEATYGFLLGMIAILLFSVVRCSGEIIEQQMGYTMSEVIDPLTGEAAQPLGTLLEVIFILFLLASNGHHLLLQAITRSYQAFPIGTIPSPVVMAAGAIKASSMMLVASLRLAAPILVAFLLLFVVLAILARIVPEMDILFLTLPVRVGIGMVMVILFLPFIQEFLSEFSRMLARLLPL
jgi:flagellar biosynthetic protein FliR